MVKVITIACWSYSIADPGPYGLHLMTQSMPSDQRWWAAFDQQTAEWNSRQPKQSSIQLMQHHWNIPQSGFYQSRFSVWIFVFPIIDTFFCNIIIITTIWHFSLYLTVDGKGKQETTHSPHIGDHLSIPVPLPLSYPFFWIALHWFLTVQNRSTRIRASKFLPTWHMCNTWNVSVLHRVYDIIVLILWTVMFRGLIVTLSHVLLPLY